MLELAITFKEVEKRRAGKEMGVSFPSFTVGFQGSHKIGLYQRQWLDQN